MNRGQTEINLVHRQRSIKESRENAMIELLKEAFTQAEQLPEAAQRALAEMILERIANDKRWDELLNDPERAAAVDALAEEALAEFKVGKFYPLSEVFEDDSL
jgi:hypothetical protein